MRSSSVLYNPAVAEPMVVIPSDSINSDNADKPSAKKSKIHPKTSDEFKPKRQKTISENMQEYTISKTKCVSCRVFVKTSFEQVFHSHVHKKGKCLYCMEEIVSGTADITNHFMRCFLTQCHIVDVLSCYMKKCSVSAATGTENSTQTQGSSLNYIISICSKSISIIGHPEAQVPSSANIDVISKQHFKRPKPEVGDTLLISKKYVEHLGKHQKSTLKSNVQYIPVSLEGSTDTQKCSVASTEISRSSVRNRLKKEKIAQPYGDFKFLWNVQKIHALKPKNIGKSLIVPTIAASIEYNNGEDILNSEARPPKIKPGSDHDNNLLLENIHNRKPNEILSMKQSGGIVTNAQNSQTTTSCIDLLSDSSDDEIFPSFVKPTNAVVKQYKGICNSNELRILSTPMQVTQNIDNPIYCSDAPSTSQLTTAMENQFSIAPSFMPFMHNTNAPHGTETSSRTATVIAAPVPQLSNIKNNPNSPSITQHKTSHLPTPAGVLITETICETKYRNIQPKPSKTNRLYNSMLLNMAPPILNTNAVLPGLSGQSWLPQQTFSPTSEPMVSTARPINTPLRVNSSKLELANHKVVNVGLPNGQHGLDRLHILSPQDINNRIS